MCSCAMIPSAAATSGVRDYGLDNRLRRALCPTRFRRGKPIGGISSCCRARHLYAVGLVALRRVAPRRAAQRPAGAAHSVRYTRTGLSQRDKLHQQETQMRPPKSGAEEASSLVRRALLASAPPMKAAEAAASASRSWFVRAPEAGLLLVILVLGLVLTIFGGSVERPKIATGPDGETQYVFTTGPDGERA